MLHGKLLGGKRFPHAGSVEIPLVSLHPRRKIRIPDQRFAAGPRFGDRAAPVGGDDPRPAHSAPGAACARRNIRPQTIRRRIPAPPPASRRRHRPSEQAAPAAARSACAAGAAFRLPPAPLRTSTAALRFSIPCWIVRSRSRPLRRGCRNRRPSLRNFSPALPASAARPPGAAGSGTRTCRRLRPVPLPERRPDCLPQFQKVPSTPRPESPDSAAGRRDCRTTSIASTFSTSNIRKTPSPLAEKRMYAVKSIIQWEKSKQIICKNEILTYFNKQDIRKGGPS